MTYRLEENARREIVEIWTYIAEDNVIAADHWLEAVIRRFELVADMPYMGRTRDELRPGYRSFPVGNYVFFYRIEQDDIYIMHVLHGRRDIENFTF